MKILTRLLVAVFASSVVVSTMIQAQSSADPDWSKLMASMDKMRMTMEATKPSGNNDVDFVRLMLPHHQAAIDMAKTQLLHARTQKCVDWRRKSLPPSNQKLS